jgi:hypothetical protein
MKLDKDTDPRQGRLDYERGRKLVRHRALSSAHRARGRFDAGVLAIRPSSWAVLLDAKTSADAVWR